MSAGDDSSTTGHIAMVVVDVTGYRRPDLVLVDTLTRIRLVAGRIGARVTVRGAGCDLARLLELVGLVTVIPLEPSSPGSEVRREAETLEEPGVEEMVDVGDRTVSHFEDLDRPRVEPAFGTGFVVGEGGRPTDLDRQQP